MKLSICLPSIYPAALQRALGELRSRTRRPYEILVCSPVEVAGPDIVWVPEPEHHGASASQAACLPHASGDFIIALADDVSVVDGWDVRLIDNFLRREHAFASVAPFCLGLRHAREGKPGTVGTCFGAYYAAFPCLRTQRARFGAWYDATYTHAWGDVDLGMHVWTLTGRCEWSERPLVELHADGDRPHEPDPGDLHAFLLRWAGSRGDGWPLSTPSFFNIDVAPEQVPQLVRGNSIHVGPEESAALIATGAPALIETVNAHNLVAWRGKIWVLPQSLGPTRLDEEDKAASLGVAAFASLDDALRAVA